MRTGPLRAVFIEPRPPDPHVFSLYALPRLGSVLLATLLRDHGWKVAVFVEEVDAIDFEQVLQADLVGISTITSTAPRSYALAEEIRRSGIPVLLGGSHVTFLPEEGLEHADMVVRGEGEEPILALADHYAFGRHLSSVPGLSYREGRRIVHNPLPRRRVDLDDLPAPDLSLIAGYGDPRMASGRVVPIQTTRGCPFRCNFCSVTTMFGRCLRRRSPESIVRELGRFRGRPARVFFYDDNFTADRWHARAICRGIIDAGLDLSFSAQVRLEVARDPELLTLLKRAGCRTLFVGFESVNPAALFEGGKSQSVDEMTRSVRTIRKAGMDVHGMFIFGFDADGPRELEATLRFARSVPITTAQFLLLTPFPGTGLYDRLSRDHRILSADWNLYDGHHVVFRPRNLRPVELQRKQVRAHWRYYSRPRSLKHLVRLKFARAAVYFYARRNNAAWESRNRSYLGALDPLPADGTAPPIPLKPRRFPDIKRALETARRKMVARNEARPSRTRL